MIRLIKNLKKFYLCQSGNWQTVVESNSEENAATKAVEKILLSEEDSANKYSFSAVVYSKRLPVYLDEDDSSTSNTLIFFAPLIMANAGFHVEAAKLQAYLDKIDLDED
jgi:hypothetical protein